MFCGRIVPPDCFTGATATGGEDGAGTYARKHEPAISFTDISTSPARCANITDFTHFDPAAAVSHLPQTGNGSIASSCHRSR